MKTTALFAPLAALGSAALLLSACGSADSASTEASADTVEMPADAALAPIAEEPVADPSAAATDAPANANDAATDAQAEAGAEQAADAAADVAAEAAAAAEKPSE